MKRGLKEVTVHNPNDYDLIDSMKRGLKGDAATTYTLHNLKTR